MHQLSETARVCAGGGVVDVRLLLTAVYEVGELAGDVDEVHSDTSVRCVFWPNLVVRGCDFWLNNCVVAGGSREVPGPTRPVE